MTQTTTQQLRTTSINRTVMDQTDIAHLAGVWDGAGAITVHIGKSDRYSIGYQFRPILRLHHPADDEVLLGKLDAYCEEYGVKYNLKDRSNERSETVVFQIIQHESIERFLTPLLPHLVSTYYDACLMLEEILPAVREGRHKTKQGLFDLLDVADELRSSARHGSQPKYTKDYFATEWKGDIKATA